MSGTVAEKCYSFTSNGVVMPFSADQFDLAQTLDCGQAFRWQAKGDGFSGIVRGKVCMISPIDNAHLLCKASRADFETQWADYFDLERDYDAIKRTLSQDETLARAIGYAPGLRLLRQEPWEALCSFIISQNNNVPRIKGIINRLCALLGDRLDDPLLGEPDGELYAFPTPERLAACSLEELAPLRAGFRARYLLDAARRVCDGEIPFDQLRLLPLEEARKILTKITGVGVKVADCTLLYSCGRCDCVPVDVWIARVLEQLYPNGLPPCVCEYAGIAQQYLFHYARTCPEAFPPQQRHKKPSAAPRGKTNAL